MMTMMMEIILIKFFFPVSHLMCLVAPKFAPLPSSKAVGIQGEPLAINLQASGNPTIIHYTWTKEGAIFDDGEDIYFVM